MPGIRAVFARSAADRDFHMYLGRAVTNVHCALDVCGRAARRDNEQTPAYWERMDRMARAEKLLMSIGHLDEKGDDADLREEARALCSWLRSRERVNQVFRPDRRGREYQARLHQVMRFLSGEDLSGDSSQVEQVTRVRPKGPHLREPETVEGVLWDRALEIARQPGEADNDAYVMTVFKRLAGEVTHPTQDLNRDHLS